MMPDLAPHVLRFVISAYGCLLLATLAWTAPSARRFFLSSRWGGYARSSRYVDAIQNPVIMPVVLGLWFASAAVLAANGISGLRIIDPHAQDWLLPAAATNLLLCRYFFIDMRWRSVSRGMGAPGFMCHWLATVVFLLALAGRVAPARLPLVVRVAQVDFALIMLSAGAFKVVAGYAAGDGMELGMANPQWGRWWRFYQRLRPNHAWFRFNNFAAWFVEIAAAILMLIPGGRWLGGLAIGLSFLYVATQIRLGLLCEMVAVCAILFYVRGSPPDRWIQAIWPATQKGGPVAPSWPVLDMALAAGLWTYLILLPAAHGGLWCNLFLHRRLPGRLQRALEVYTNAFGIIIWRVFSADHTRFYVRILCRQDARREIGNGPFTLPGDCTSAFELSRWGADLRYAHVGEAIAVTSIFTSLRYYPSDPGVFQERLLRYARTLGHPGCVKVFEVMELDKTPDGFSPRLERVFVVDAGADAVRDEPVIARASARRRPIRSVIVEAAKPGSYAPPRHAGDMRKSECRTRD